MSVPNKPKKESPILPYVKIAVLGARHSGKTSLVSRLCTGEFSSSQVYVHTTEPSSQLTTLTHADYKVPMQAREVGEAGIEARFVECPSNADEDQLRRVLEETFCTIMIYDVTDRASFDEARTLWASAATKYSPQSLKMLVGCKIDMVSSIAVDWTELSEEGSDNFFLEVSAADGTNIDLISNIIYLQARRIVQKQISEVDGQDVKENDDEENHEKQRYELHLRQGYEQESSVLKDLQKICGSVKSEQGSTIQDILNSMPFAFTKSSAGSLFDVVEAKNPKADKEYEYSSPLGEAMTALVDRLAKERLRSGVAFSSDSENDYEGRCGMNMHTREASASDAQEQRYTELKEAFSLCGIKIEPPFPTPAIDEPKTPPPPNEQVQVPPPPPLPPVSLLTDGGSEKSAKNAVHEGGSSSDVSIETGMGKTANEEIVPSAVSGKLAVSPQRRQDGGGRQRTPMKRDVIVIKVKLPGDRGEAQIHARQGDSPIELAGAFIAKHGLAGGDATLQKLAKLIHTKVAATQTRLSRTPTSTPGSRQSTPSHSISTPVSTGSLLTPAKPSPSGSSTPAASTASPMRSTIPKGQTQGEEPTRYTAAKNLTRGQEQGGGPVLVKLDIALGRTGKTGKIVIRVGDDAHHLVTNFCRAHPGIFNARQAEHLKGQVSKVIRERSHKMTISPGAP